MTTQELIDLRSSIVEGRTQDALAIVDELDGMSKKDILFKIESYLTVMLIHLIKNQIEGRLTNSWAASIRNSIRGIKKLNLQGNKTAYYIKEDGWDEMLEEAIEFAVREASVEVEDGAYSQFQLMEMVDRTALIATAKSFVGSIYSYSAKDLPAIIDDNLVLLAGGEDWKLGKK